MPVLVVRAAVIKYIRQCDVKQEKLSHNPGDQKEIQNQGVGRVNSFQGL